VFLYIHSEKRGAQGGIDLVKLAHACGIPEDRLVWVDQWAYYAGLPSSVLAGIIASFDVHLMCSRGEGFGVPVLEAAACGVPSIVSAFTAQPELVADHGWVTAVQPDWDALQSAWFATPLIHCIVENLQDAYLTSVNPERRAAARSHAEFYEHSVVFDRYWKPILTEIDKRMGEA
jgi:glycosyltransferase involved in cell wall biosynthesis